MSDGSADQTSTGLIVSEVLLNRNAGIGSPRWAGMGVRAVPGAPGMARSCAGSSGAGLPWGKKVRGASGAAWAKEGARGPPRRQWAKDRLNARGVVRPDADQRRAPGLRRHAGKTRGRVRASEGEFLRTPRNRSHGPPRAQRPRNEAAVKVGCGGRGGGGGARSPRCRHTARQADPQPAWQVRRSGFSAG